MSESHRSFSGGSKVKNHAWLRIPCILALLLFLQMEAWAQTASSFEQLQLSVQKGDQVSVTETDGKVTKGRIDDVSSSSLRLLRNRMPIELLEARVLEIKKKDPIGNGARRGALVGGAIVGGLGGLVASAFCERDCILGTAAGVALGGGIGAGMGAGIGVAIDAITNRSTTVYRAKPRGAARFNIAPVLSKASTGIVLSISF
jgi:hypothetical protein